MQMMFTQSYQIGEELARAFTERTILQIFLEDERNAPAGSLKVHIHFPAMSGISGIEALLYFGMRLLCDFSCKSNIHVTLNFAFAGCIGLTEVYVCHGLHR
jgi:hypothetical protein